MSSQSRGNTHTHRLQHGMVYPQRMGQQGPGDKRAACWRGQGRQARQGTELVRFHQVPPGKSDGLVNWNSAQRHVRTQPARPWRPRRRSPSQLLKRPTPAGEGFPRCSQPGGNRSPRPVSPTKGTAPLRPGLFLMALSMLASDPSPGSGRLRP